MLVSNIGMRFKIPEIIKNNKQQASTCPLKVGDRIKTKYKMGTSGNIETGTVVGLNGVMIEVDLDNPNAGLHSCCGKARQGHGWYFDRRMIIKI